MFSVKARRRERAAMAARCPLVLGTGVAEPSEMLALPHLSGAECLDALARLGFVPHRSRGGLVTMKSPNGAVIVPEACTLGPAVVASIVRAAGVEPLDFLRALDGGPHAPTAAESAPSVA